MAKPKAPKEILAAKVRLEQEISDTMYIIVLRFQAEHTGWLVTEADIGVIDISTFEEQRRMTASSRVELTNRELTLKICKAGLVKEVRP